jgi:hypothetical protein
VAWSCIQHPAHRKVYRPLRVVDIIDFPHQGKKNPSGLASLALATPLTILPPLQGLVGYNNALSDREGLHIRGGHLLLCYARDLAPSRAISCMTTVGAVSPAHGFPTIEPV